MPAGACPERLCHRPVARRSLGGPDRLCRQRAVARLLPQPRRRGLHRLSPLAGRCRSARPDAMRAVLPAAGAGVASGQRAGIPDPAPAAGDRAEQGRRGSARSAGRRPNSGDYWYFPKGERGLGHAISNYAPDGSLDSASRATSTATARRTRSATRWSRRSTGDGRRTAPNAGRSASRLPSSSTTGVRPSLGSSRARSLPWRTWTVQLRLLGDEYLKSHRLPFVSGDPTAHVPSPPAPAP